MFRPTSTFLSLFALMLITPVLLAQSSTATLFGTVTDQTGAVIPKARIILTETETKAVRNIVTREDGAYRAEFLPVGPYSLTVTMPGFKSLDRSGITLTVGQEAQLDLTLQNGAINEVIEVNADIPLMNNANATLGKTVEGIEIDNLPLVDRNAYALLDLTPGVQANNSITASSAGTNGQGAVGGDINTTGFPEQHVKINGSTDGVVGQVSYYLDGSSNLTGLRSTGNPMPNPDALSQFRTDTNNFSAQFGRTSGGVVSAITKSGTNKFHGSVFEFFRDRNFNATPHLYSTKTPYNQHRFGFTAGGPLKRDKIFFFGSYAGFRFISDKTFVNAEPSAAMKRGDFTENLPTTGLTGAKACQATAAATKFYVCDPVTRLPMSLNGKPNIVDPKVSFDPAIYNMIQAGLFPDPNPSQPSDSAYTRRDLSPFTQTTNEQLSKGDYQVTSKQRLTLSYFHLHGVNIFDASSNNTLNYSKQNYHFNQHNAGIQHVWTLTNNTVNQIFIGYTRMYGTREDTPYQSLASFGSTYMQQLVDGTICGTSSRPGCARPQLVISGWNYAGNAGTGPATGSNILQTRDILNTTHGKHSIFLGGEAALERDFQNVATTNFGVFTFSQVNNTAARTSAAITDFFFGRPASMNQAIPEYVTSNYWNYGLYFQDDWRAAAGITLNLGIRYDIQTVPLDGERRQVGFQPGVQSSVMPSAPIGIVFPGDKGVNQGGASTKYDHISPRVGVVWDPYKTGKTVFRAGGGIFYGTVSAAVFSAAATAPPFGGSPTYTKVISVAKPYETDPSEFCPSANGGCTVGVSPFPYVWSAANSKFVVHPIPAVALDPNFAWPAIYQFNVGFQQQFTRSFAISASYVGSQSRKIPIYNDLNYPIYTPGAPTTAPTSGSAAAMVGTNYPNTATYSNNRRPFNQTAALGASTGLAGNPTYATVYRIQSSESANYHGLQVTGEERLSNRFTVRGFYIWSKSLQSEPLDGIVAAAGANANLAPEDPNYKYLDKERSDWDIRHMVAISGIYKMQYAAKNFYVRSLINGWTISSIIRIQSGMPFLITTGTDVNGDGNTNDRPNMVNGAKPHLNDVGHSRAAAMKSWVSSSQFCIFNPTTGACPGTGPGGVDGTLRANALDAPGRRSIDASLFRDFNVYDRVTFQLRGEATNVFNLTNLPGPTSTTNGSGFGQINGTISGGSFGNRVLQVGGRILF